MSNTDQTLPPKALQQTFTQKLMHWHQCHNHRSLPWKGVQDPYCIWLSEVLLQQTRAQQALPYYEKFLAAFPDVHAMASADDAEVFLLWQGLGYYNRCRNMLAAARHISRINGGRFPDSYDGLLALPGVGPYTAAAVASFAFGLPYAVVDGNVYRVLARFFGIETPSDSTLGKRQFFALAQALLYTGDSAAYNQAIMDLGATICTPLAPRCAGCPLQTACFAHQHDAWALLPVRRKKNEVRKRYFHYLLLHAEGQIWIRRRREQDIWQDLHEPYLIELPSAAGVTEISRSPAFQCLQGNEPLEPLYVDSITQRLTHQLIESRFFTVSLQRRAGAKLPGEGIWVAPHTLKNFAMPKTLVSFFEKNLYF